MPRKKSDTRGEANSPRDVEVWTGPERRQEPRGMDGSGGGGPRLRRKTDDSLAQEIHEILTGDPELDATEIEVVVEGGAVTLSGEVEHPDAKLLAEELTESVAGVRLVHNRLVVRR
jgi:osmotically-inducible protein OsmY